MNLLEWSRLKHGNIYNLARVLNKSYGTVHPWVYGRKKIAEESCPKIALFTGVPLSVLRPDINWETKLNELMLAVRVS